MDRSRKGRFPPGFRHHDMNGRRDDLRRLVSLDDDEWDAVSGSPGVLKLSDVMVESEIGCLPLPLAVADGFLIDGRDVSIPMAVEEPSVVAAACYAARIVRGEGGFHAWASEPRMTTQIFLEGAADDAELRLSTCEEELKAAISVPLQSLERRGGGYRGFRVSRLPSGALRVDLVIDVRDSMGANRLNTAAESARAILERESGGRVLMAVLSNDGAGRVAGARFSVPWTVSRRGFLREWTALKPPGASPRHRASPRRTRDAPSRTTRAS